MATPPDLRLALHPNSDGKMGNLLLTISLSGLGQCGLPIVTLGHYFLAGVDLGFGFGCASKTFFGTS